MQLDAVHERQTPQEPTLLILVPARLVRTFPLHSFPGYLSFGVLSVGQFFLFPFGFVHSQEMVWYNLTG